MLSISPLATIYAVIQQVCTNATSNASLFQSNEAATRAALIDPILRALGWDTTDVRMVEPERMVANKQKLDYLLKDSQGNIRSVVEAKKMGESLDKLGHVGALIGYAFSLKPTNFFITDGLNWHYYSPSHSSYEPVATLNLRDANPIEAALQMVQWLDAALSGHGIPTIGKNEKLLANADAKATAKLPKPISKAKKIAPGFIELTQLNLADLLPGQKPKHMQLPNGTVKSIAKWKDILLEISNLLLATNTNLPIPLPDKAKKKRFLISWDKQPVGASTKLNYQGKAVFVGTNYSASDCLANAAYLAQLLPDNQKGASMAIRF